jgi:RNA polymerase sigma-70 factor (sigma-E family)
MRKLSADRSREGTLAWMHPGGPGMTVPLDAGPPEAGGTAVVPPHPASPDRTRARRGHGEERGTAMRFRSAGSARPGRWVRPARRARPEPEAGDALATLHREHYAALVRLANLLLDDQGRAEETVQDAFVKLQLRWGGLRQVERAPAYLRSAVLNGARSALRHGRVVHRHAERRTVVPDVPTPEAGALAAAEHQRIVAALRLLPARQREALALRYYLDLGEAAMAAAMGVSPGSVKTHLRRGLASLARLLGEEGGGDGGDGATSPAGTDDGAEDER